MGKLILVGNDVIEASGAVAGIKGGNDASVNLEIESTGHATKGIVKLQPNGGGTSIGGDITFFGGTTPAAKVVVADSTQEKLATFLLDRCLSDAGLAIGSLSKAKVLIANTVSFLSNGVFKSKTTAEVAFTVTTHDLANGYRAIYLMSLQADGTATITKGATVAKATTPTAPAVPTGETYIGEVDITANSGAFTAATTDLDAATLIVAYRSAVTPSSGVSSFSTADTTILLNALQSYNLV